jgi:CSLREA domain-containing protein
MTKKISLLSLFAIVLLALAAPAVASAATFTVNSTGDQTDEDPGVGGCETTLGTCTLRAAVEESNAFDNDEADTIDFGPSFNGEPADTITLGSALPAIEEELIILGGSSEVEIAGQSTGTVLAVEAEHVTISGLSLSLSGSTTGIAVASEALITGNSIAGGQIGIHTGGVEIGSNEIEGNLIEGTGGPGILIENDINDVAGNEILDSGAAGVRVHSSGLVTADLNTIGAPGFLTVPETNENVISGSDGPAVEINTVEEDGGDPTANRVFRNTGSGNSGPFIDLVPIEPLSEPIGPNGGILPPKIASATKTEVSGTSEPEAWVRIYRKATTAVGEIESFLGLVVADESGNWALTYSAAIPAGTSIAANQTPEGEALGSSELAIANVPSDPPPPSCATDASLCPPSQPKPTPTPAPTPKPKPVKCKKGFVKKKSGGKTRCVKVKKKHKKHH